MSRDIDYVRNLEDKGLTREQSEEIVKATRGTVADELKPFLARFEGKFAEFRSDVKMEIASGVRQTTLAIGLGVIAIVAAIIFG